MAQNDKNVSKFLDAMASYAREKAEQTHREVEAYKAQRLQEEEQKALTESAQIVNREHDRLQTEISLELSRRDMAARRELFACRNGIADKVFALAEERLCAYTETPAYPERLCRSLKRMVQILPAENTVFYLSERDKTLFDTLRPLCPTGSRLETSAQIRIGGIRGFNEAAGIVADDTLDSKLACERSWFAENSGLTVE